jgi:hypothetical protein
LESKGAKITTCGTGLDHFGLNDKLLVSEIGAINGTVEIMSNADKIIRPN